MSPAVSAPKTTSDTYFAADTDTSKPRAFACTRATPPCAQPCFCGRYRRSRSAVLPSGIEKRIASTPCRTSRSTSVGANGLNRSVGFQKRPVPHESTWRPADDLALGEHDLDGQQVEVVLEPERAAFGDHVVEIGQPAAAVSGPPATGTEDPSARPGDQRRDPTRPSRRTASPADTSTRFFQSSRPHARAVFARLAPESGSVSMPGSSSPGCARRA